MTLIIMVLAILGLGLIKLYFLTEGRINRARTRGKKQIEMLKFFGSALIYWLILIAVNEYFTFTWLDIAVGIILGLLVVWVICMISISNGN